MSVFIAGTGLWLPGSRDPATLLADLTAGRSRAGLEIDTPSRPSSIPAGGWRRMSQLARMAIGTAAPLLEGRTDLEHLGLVWGTRIGEIVPTARFLERLIQEGPERASPLSFQNSVYNAPAGHLSIALGLRGPSETVSAGGATGLAALLRGADLIRLGMASTVLVLAGDDRNDTRTAAYAYVNHGGDPTDLVAAVLLTTVPTPVELIVRVGPPTCVTFRRSQPIPGEHEFQSGEGLPTEPTLGTTPISGLAAVVALAEAGGTVVDQDGPTVLHATVTR